MKNINKNKKQDKHTEPTEIQTPAKNIKPQYIYLIILLFTFLIYANAIPNNYALDDGIVITENNFTKKGISGIADIFSSDTMSGAFLENWNLLSGGRYRPFSVATFAIEYQIFGQNPHISHIINILIYALTGILIFILLSKILENIVTSSLKNKWYFSVPFIAAILFIAHPIHTEAVTNIKGRDELLALLGSLSGLWFILKYFENKVLKYYLAAFLSFLLAMFSKENAIIFLAILPLTLYFFRKADARSIFNSSIPIILAAFIFLCARHLVLSKTVYSTPIDLMNNSFVHATFSEKYGTILYTLLIDLKLLFFPHPLTWDYYPYHIPLVSFSDFRSLISLAIYITLATIAILGLRKRNNLIAYGIIIYFAGISIVSNIFFPIGAFMSERFLYLPSLGFTIIIVYLLFDFIPERIESKSQELSYIQSITIIMTLVLFFFIVKTVTRNFDWKDSFTLFTTDVKTSPNSAKGNSSAGEQYMIEGLKKSNVEDKASFATNAIIHFQRAIVINPMHMSALLDLGNCYEKFLKDYKTAIELYLTTIQYNPNFKKAYAKIDELLFTVLKDSIDIQIITYEKLNEIAPNQLMTIYRLAKLYAIKGKDINKAFQYFNRALQLSPNNPDILTDMGAISGQAGDYAKSLELLELAYKFAPNNLYLLKNLRVTYFKLGYKEKELEISKKLQQFTVNQ